jgi:arylsulfatase A-like enzyme
MFRAALLMLALAGCTWETPEVKPTKTVKSRPPRNKAEAAAKAEQTQADPNRPVPQGKPNVLLIVWDTVRADRTTPYGYALDTTPRLQELAKEGRVYERAVSPGMWTVPGHASMFTGLPESAHGANAQTDWLDSRFQTLAETFVDGGWGTYLFAANPHLQDHTNLAQGFEKREYPEDERWAGKARKSTRSKLIPTDASNTLGPAFKGGGKYPSGRSSDGMKDAAPVAGEALMTWLDERPDKQRPFFAVLNMMEAHVPRVPSLESRKALFSEEQIQAQLAFDQSYGYLLAYTVGLHEFTAEQQELISQVYDASLRDIDRATGAIFDQLRAKGLLDNTVVIVTADHGEHLGDHHRADHKFSVYNALVRVPLVVRYPAAFPAGREPKVVSNLDLYATLTEIAGLKLPDGTLSRSLLHLEDRPSEAYSELVEPTRLVFDRMRKVHKDFDSAPWELQYAAIEAADLKCIKRSDGHVELFDMASDPLEAKDLAGQRAAEATALCARIDAWRATFPAYDPSKTDKKQQEMTPALQKQLEELGYVSGEEKP